MKKSDFLKIMLDQNPQELNEFIELKGKKKAVSLFLFMKKEESETGEEK